MNKLINAILHPRRAFAVMLDIVESKLLPPQSQSKVSLNAKKLWSSSVSDIYVQDISHWSGKGRWADEQSWNQIGQKHLKMFKELCLLSAVTKPINSMIEWGPGGGANAIWFCSEVKDFYGIDISKANLSECQQQLEMRNFKCFYPILIDIEKPDECFNHINSHVDFFISTAVYQHFPSKQYGIHITELAHRLLTDNGIAIIQIRYDSDSKYYKPKHRNYDKNVITFTSYYIHEFWEICLQIGFKPLSIILEPQTHYAYYFLKKEIKI